MVIPFFESRTDWEMRVYLKSNRLFYLNGLAISQKQQKGERLLPQAIFEPEYRTGAQWYHCLNCWWVDRKGWIETDGVMFEHTLMKYEEFCRREALCTPVVRKIA